MSSLEGKIALVIGGGRGIGEAVSLALGAAGAIVCVRDRDAENAEHVRDAIVAQGGRADTGTLDVLDGDQIDAGVQAVLAEHGRVDVLANVAGGMLAYVPWRPLHEWPQEDWDFVLALNLTYVYRTVRATIPAMIEAGGGSIVNIASTAGLVASPRMSPYGAAKAGLINLTRSMSAEYGQYGIRANCVAPGTVSTPATTGKPEGDVFNEAAAMIPLKRRGIPADIAGAVVFLASDDASYVTGQTLSVDGGMTQRFQLPLPGSDVSEAVRT